MLRVYELINPSDAITFRATPEVAAVVSAKMSGSLYFVRDAETGDDPIEAMGDRLQSFYDSIWCSPDLIAAYAEAYRSFLVGSPRDRALYEDVTSRMSQADAADFAAKWHDEKRTSLNDICQSCWTAAKNIAQTQPKEPTP